MNEEKIIQLDQLISNGVVHEEYKDINTSIFGTIYSRAGRLVDKIISDNYEWIENGKNRKNSDFERSNIISFVGQRGTGKTSAMLSFKDMLDSYTKVQRFSLNQTPMSLFDIKKYPNIKFYTLDCIDASIMEESENVFILILAAMFSEIQKYAYEKTRKINEYDNRILYQKFEKIYEDYTSINSKENVQEGYSAFEKLRNAASNQKIRENFEELVKLYLDLIDNDVQNFSKTDQKFLVISLDDIDIARRKKGNGKDNWGTYKIMSTIYKYLTVPGVIVLTAYDYSNLQERCMNFFEIENGQREGCERATLQFIEKVFPIYSRLYMPALINNKIISKNEIKISIANNRRKILDRFWSEERVLSIKDFVFYFLYDKTDVVLDYESRKNHFFVPDTLRDLFNLVELLNKMEIYSHEIREESDIEKFQYNIQWLEDDCDFRYKEEILANRKEESNLITLWNEMPIEERGKKIVWTISKNTIPLGLDVKRKYKVDIDSAKKANSDPEKIKDFREYNNSSVEYSYAELVHSIFHMSRYENGFSKKFVACILYSYTLQLTEIYHLYLWNRRFLLPEEFFSVYRNHYEKKVDDRDLNIRKEKIKKYYGELAGVIGKTICGKWAQYFFPEMEPVVMLEDNNSYINVRQKLVIAGYINNRGVEFAFEILESDNIDTLALKIKTMLFISMLRLDISTWTFENLECRMENEGRYVLCFHQNETEDIEFTAFLKHTFLYTEFLNKIECLVLDQFKDDKKSRQLRKKIKGVFSELWKAYYEWECTYGNAMIPFYNLDVVYNMIKKLYLEHEQGYMRPIIVAMNDENTDFLIEYQKMMDRFKQHLGNIDNKYYLEKNGVMFSEIFEKCPFYNMVIELQKDSESRVRISNYICNVGLDIVADRISLIEPRE